MSSYKVSPTAQDLLLNNHVSTTTAATFLPNINTEEKEHNRANIFPHREPSANTNSHRNYCTSYLQQQQVVATIFKLRETILLLANSYQQSPFAAHTVAYHNNSEANTAHFAANTSCLSLSTTPPS